MVVKIKILEKKLVFVRCVYGQNPLVYWVLYRFPHNASNMINTQYKIALNIRKTQWILRYSSENHLSFSRSKQISINFFFPCCKIFKEYASQ